MPESKKKSIRVLFYRIILPRRVSNTRLNRLMSELVQKNEADRTKEFDQAKHLLVPFSSSGGFYFTLAKERTGEWPAWLRKGGKVDEIKLPEGTLAETTCFWLAPKEGVLAEAYSHFAPKPSHLKKYLIHVGQEEDVSLDRLSFEPIMKKDVYAEFANMNYHRKLTFKVANPSPEFWDEMSSKDHFREVLQLLNDSNGLTMEVTISVDRAKKKLNSGFVQRIVRPLFRQEGKASKLKVWGSEDMEGPSHPIDLIHDRLVHYNQVNINGHYVLINDYIDAIKQGFIENRDYLAQIVASEADQE